MVGKRVLFAAIGLLATFIALIGIWLPGVPTVFPLLIALWAFSKSSQRLHDALLRLPLLQDAMKEVRAYEKHRSITKRVKRIAQTSAWLSVIVLAVVTRNVWIVAATASVALACSAFMLWTPTRRLEPKASLERGDSR